MLYRGWIVVHEVINIVTSNLGNTNQWFLWMWSHFWILLNSKFWSHISAKLPFEGAQWNVIPVKLFITGNFGIQRFEFPNFYFPAIEVIQNGNSTNCLKSSNDYPLRHFEVSRPLGILHYGPPQSARPLQGPKKLQPSFACIVYICKQQHCF